jgi:apolipoprotein N-acyltransferase
VGALLRGAAAALSGLAAAASFEPVGWALLLPLAVAGLSLSVTGIRGWRAFVVGTVFGLAFMGGLLPWLQVIGVDAWIGLSLLEGAFFGLLGVLVARVSRLPVAPVWAACCWVGVEVLRSLVPWGGFPWGRLAFATIDTPLAAAMPWLGAAGTTFLVALLGTSLAGVVLAVARKGAASDRRSRGRRVADAMLVLCVAVSLALVPSVLTDPPGDAPDAPTVRVVAVQGNVPGEGMDAFAERRVVLENHVEATHRLAEQVAAGITERPDLVLWPENSTDLDPYANPDVAADIQGAVDSIGVPVLVGAMVGGPEEGDVRNQGIVWLPGSGPADSYSKMHPVPFGEYIPHRDQLAQLFERLDQIPRDMVPGTEPGLLEMGGTTLGDVICFEVAYDDVVHAVVEGGARMLVVQTNNATYMGTGQVEQQFATARLRALETHRWVTVVATNGVSGIVAPDGRVVERAPVRTTSLIAADIPQRTDLTPAVRYGRLVAMALVLLAALAVTATLVITRRERRSRRGAQETPDAALDSAPDTVPAEPSPDPAGRAT